jgi:nickel/cobalt transporter (NicO) family protein
VQVAAAVALMHTASVLALGLVVLALASVAPERVYPWLTMASGVVVLLLGAGMLRRRLRTRPPRAPSEDDHSVHHAHEHGPHTHSHGSAHPADALGERPLSRRSLSALALSGGILPSPTALVVLLSTVHADRIGFGLGLILAFSVGMAATLAGIGLLALGSRNVLAARMHGGVGRLVPVASAATILGVGTFLVARAALQL